MFSEKGGQLSNVTWWMKSVKWCVCFPAAMGFSECVQSVTEVRGCKNSKYQLDLLLSDNVMVLTSTMIQVCHVLHRRPSGEGVAIGEK